MIYNLMIILVENAAKTVSRRWKVLFPYDAKGTFGHISIFDDEEVEEVKEDTGGWTVVRQADGKEGGVPTKCLGIIISKYCLKQHYSGHLDESLVKKLKALFSFDSKGIFGHLSLHDGEVVIEVTPDREGWTVVRNADGDQGGVPTTRLGSFSVYFLVK